MSLLCTGYLIWVFLSRRPDEKLTLELLAFAAIDVLPLLALPWLAVWGLSLGCEPGTGFRTRISSYRASFPVPCSAFAGARLASAAAGWLLIWLPILACTWIYDADLRGTPHDRGMDGLRTALAWKMAVTAHAMIGALPLVWRGRVEGFPNLLLCGMCAWFGTWLLAGFLDASPGPVSSARWIGAILLLVLKLGLGAAALVSAVWRGAASRRFAGILCAGWCLLLAGLGWGLPVAESEGAWGVVGIALMLPFARLAASPLALASNRYR
jgi:hypothetical protein